MSHSDKIASAISLIEEHNSQIDNQEDKIDTAEFQRKLKKLGGTTEAALAECTWEDLENAGLPRILARKVATIFRTAATPVAEDPNYISQKKAERLHPMYLLQAYDPSDATSPVAKRLKEISRGQKFVVFNYGTQVVNTEASLSLLEEIKKGYPERSEYELDGKLVKTFAIGEGAFEMVDENPLYPGRPLRPDGTCDQTNRSWAGISLYLRQLAYMAFGKKGVTFDKAHDVLDTVTSPDAEKKLRSRFPKVVIELDDLIQLNQAPTLKIRMSPNGVDKKSNNPFFTNHRQY